MQIANYPRHAWLFCFLFISSFILSTTTFSTTTTTLFFAFFQNMTFSYICASVILHWLYCANDTFLTLIPLVVSLIILIVQFIYNFKMFAFENFQNVKGYVETTWWHQLWQGTLFNSWNLHKYDVGFLSNNHFCARKNRVTKIDWRAQKAKLLSSNLFYLALSLLR